MTGSARLAFLDKRLICFVALPTCDSSEKILHEGGEGDGKVWKEFSRSVRLARFMVHLWKRGACVSRSRHLAWILIDSFDLRWIGGVPTSCFRHVARVDIIGRFAVADRGGTGLRRHALF